VSAELIRFRAVIGDMKIAMLTTVSADGVLRGRPVAAAQFGPAADIYFFARTSSAVVEDVRSAQNVNLGYVALDGKRFASVCGSAAIVDDRETAKTIWGPWCAAWFPRGVDDPDLALVRVRVSTVEYWESPLDDIAHLVEFVHGPVATQSV
jgi:general stress protein 26